MATEKQPKFTHPVLEVGVPQYPTPYVPDFYKKSGHIVLVEKVDVQKGNYNPQPLDGSVIYKNPDADKYPSPLYLVAERPTPDGEHCYRFWANDRTYAEQDPWNYGISYSSENPDYPVYSREYIIARDDYDAFPLGQQDPVFGGNAIIVKQQMAELPDDNSLRSRYVSVQVVYETIPGPALPGYIASAEFGPARSTTEVVKSGSIAYANYNTIKSDVQPIDSVKSKIEFTEYVNLNTLKGSQWDGFFQNNLNISRSIVPANSAPLGYFPGLLSYKDDPVNYYQTQRTIVSTPSLPPTRIEYKTASFSSPQLVFGLDVSYQQFDAVGSDVRLRITPITRASQSRLTIQRITTSLSYYAPTPPNPSLILSPELKRVAYTGYSVSFDLGDALCDQLLANGTGAGYGNNLVNISNQMLAGFSNTGYSQLPIYEIVNIPATAISASAYNALIGTFQTTSFESEYWKSNIWISRKVDTYIV